MFTKPSTLLNICLIEPPISPTFMFYIVLGHWKRKAKNLPRDEERHESLSPASHTCSPEPRMALCLGESFAMSISRKHFCLLALIV